ncbi:hypothetical protein MXB_835 [Myxobolus squamalis]|nr:hypothetical protein MXB_835 [Myxobolus squamalis]
MSDSHFKVPERMMNTILTKSVEIIFTIFEQKKYQIRIVGGAVRDIIMGKTPKDIDFATNAKPNEIKNVCRNIGITCIVTGSKHGTLTAVVDKLKEET